MKFLNFLRSLIKIHIFKKIFKLFEKIRNFNRRPFYGFVRGHDYINKNQIEDMKELIAIPSKNFNTKLEQKFASYLGCDNAVSFASGRMGFYALLKILDIKAGDEIVLTGATCAVMINAVMRIGATPIYADISMETFGTSSDSVRRCLSSRTKVVVAQHSFGIPCDIKEIASITKQKGIFLVEDCALCLGSTLDGKEVGLFGDAALFSFDHTKPINSMIGGMMCTNSELHSKLKRIQEQSPEIPISKRKALFKRFKLEQRYCNSKKFSQLQLIDLILSKIREIFHLETPFLTEDSNSLVESKSSYPYPAKMPEFIAYLALIELKRWPRVKEERRKIASKYITLLRSYGFESEINSVYAKDDKDIIPLRLVWRCDNGLELRNRMKDFLHIEQTWFRRPIVDTKEKLKNFYYINGSCPVSETLENTVINLPTSVSLEEIDIIIKKLSVLNEPQI